MLPSLNRSVLSEGLAVRRGLDLRPPGRTNLSAKYAIRASVIPQLEACRVNIG